MLPKIHFSDSQLPYQLSIPFPIVLSISPSDSPATYFWHSAEIKTDVSQQRWRDKAMHKTKIGPDMAHVGGSIRLSQLLCQNCLRTLEKDLHCLKEVLLWLFSNGK